MILMPTFLAGFNVGVPDNSQPEQYDDTSYQMQKTKSNDVGIGARIRPLGITAERPRLRRELPTT
jgi:hypothetical protein